MTLAGKGVLEKTNVSFYLSSEGLAEFFGCYFAAPPRTGSYFLPYFPFSLPPQARFRDLEPNDLDGKQ